MKKNAGKIGIALIFGALSAISGFVLGEVMRQRPLDITKLKKNNEHTEDNKPA